MESEIYPELIPNILIRRHDIDKVVQSTCQIFLFLKNLTGTTRISVKTFIHLDKLCLNIILYIRIQPTHALHFYVQRATLICLFVKYCL